MILRGCNARRLSGPQCSSRECPSAHHETLRRDKFIEVVSDAAEEMRSASSFYEAAFSMVPARLRAKAPGVELFLATDILGDRGLGVGIRSRKTLRWRSSRLFGPHRRLINF